MNDIEILVLRIIVGIVMAAHGLPKLFWKRKEYNQKWKDKYHFPLGSVVMTGMLQLLGGLAIIMGVYIQLSAIILVLNMLVATYISIWIHEEPFLSTPEGKGWDVNFLLIGALIILSL